MTMGKKCNLAATLLLLLLAINGITAQDETTTVANDQDETTTVATDEAVDAELEADAEEEAEAEDEADVEEAEAEDEADVEEAEAEDEADVEGEADGEEVEAAEGDDEGGELAEAEEQDGEETEEEENAEADDEEQEEEEEEEEDEEEEEEEDEEEAAEEEDSENEDESGSGEDGSGEDGSGEDGSGDESGSGEDESWLRSSCDLESISEPIQSCLAQVEKRLEAENLEETVTLVLVQKGVVDCDSDEQCADDRACMNSYREPGRMLCELPCQRHRCAVPFSECVAEDHLPRCECKAEFHGNASVECVPDGFEAADNGKNYRLFDDEYTSHDNATRKCRELGARLPVLDSRETIEVVKDHMERANFSVFEQWDRSSRRVWLGLSIDRGSALRWDDGADIGRYPASSRLFVWESRRMLSQESGYADSSRNYALYIDGDIAKLPGGGRKGAAVLCELLPNNLGADPNAYYDPYAQTSYEERVVQPQDGGYPNYPNNNNY